MQHSHDPVKLEICLATVLVSNLKSFINYGKPRPFHKSTSDWGKRELKEFNVQVIRKDNIESFFGLSSLPTPSGISHVVLENLTMPHGEQKLSKEEELFFIYPLDATIPDYGGAPLVRDFTRFLLQMLRYDAGGECALRSSFKISFPMCGESVKAEPDFSIIEHLGENYGCRLVVQIDWRHLGVSDSDPEPQLIAQALAAFDLNNRSRVQLGHPPLESQTLPGIIMVGTVPVFYKIPVTGALANAVARGVYHEKSTVVQKFVPPVPIPGNWDDSEYRKQGMVPLNNRLILFRCFEAFKKFLVAVV